MTTVAIGYVRRALPRVRGVDAVFLGPHGGRHLTVYAVAREHGAVDRAALLRIEGDVARLGIDLAIRVRAHQDRQRPAAVMPYRLLFSKDD